MSHHRRARNATDIFREVSQKSIVDGQPALVQWASVAQPMVW